jgi:Skp family chaperone for outer membrane proteins
MKKFISYFIGALLLTAAPIPTLLTSAEAAARPKQPIVAVLDVQRILTESLAAADLRNQVQAKLQKYQEELKKKETELRAADQEIARQATVLSEDKLKEKREDLSRRALEAAQQVEKRRRALEEGSAAGLREVEVALTQVVQKIAADNQIDIVLRKSQVFYVGADLDITDQALIDLNKKISSVKLRVDES